MNDNKLYPTSRIFFTPPELDIDFHVTSKSTQKIFNPFALRRPKWAQNVKGFSEEEFFQVFHIDIPIFPDVIKYENG